MNTPHCIIYAWKWSRFGVRIVSKFGDIRRFHSANALIAYAGLDSPSY